jgi:hypothetical protein
MVAGTHAELSESQARVSKRRQRIGIVLLVAWAVLLFVPLLTVLGLVVLNISGMGQRARANAAAAAAAPVPPPTPPAVPAANTTAPAPVSGSP